MRRLRWLAAAGSLLLAGVLAGCGAMQHLHRSGDGTGPGCYRAAS